jgi:hypothetical protein
LGEEAVRAPHPHRDGLPASGKPVASHDQRHVLPTQRLEPAESVRLATSSSNRRNTICDRLHRSLPTRRDLAQRRSKRPKSLESTSSCGRVRARGCGRNTPGRGRNAPELFNLIQPASGRPTRPPGRATVAVSTPRHEHVVYESSQFRAESELLRSVKSTTCTSFAGGTGPASRSATTSSTSRTSSPSRCC